MSITLFNIVYYFNKVLIVIKNSKHTYIHTYIAIGILFITKITSKPFL